MKKTYILLFFFLSSYGILRAQTVLKPEFVYKHYTYADIIGSDTMFAEMTLEGTFRYNGNNLLSGYGCYSEYGPFGNEYYGKGYWYDNDARLIKYSYSGWDGGGIYGADSVYYEYDNDLLSYTKKLHVDKWGGWYYTDSTKYYYDNEGCVNHVDNYVWNYSNAYWELGGETNYYITETGKEVVTTNYFSPDVIKYRKISHYDPEGLLLDECTERYSDYGALIIGDKSSYGYENGICRSKTTQKWVLSDSCWVNESFLVFNYNSLGIMTEEVAQTWVDGQWQNSQRTRWDADEDGIVSSITYEAWVDSLFVNSKKVEYHYDGNGLCTGVDGMVWYEEDWVPGMAGINGVGGSNERVFWDESFAFEDDLIRATAFSFTTTTITWQTLYSDVEENDNPTGNHFAVYPNPTNNVLFIEACHDASLPSQTYRITNIAGKTLQQGSVRAKTQQIHIESLPAGLYLITVGNQVLKFTKY